MANRDPIILCHGLFGWGPAELGGYPYWGMAARVHSPLPRYVASVGPISSTHDRACELAYQIRGGTVDYGEAHASSAGHARFGRTFPAFHPNWSAQRPVHLVGHSLGAATIWWMQQLLAEDYFGWGSSADWVRSVSSISGVLNGSTATYYMGAHERTGLLQPRTAASFLARIIELQLRLTGRAFKRLYDFDLAQWGIDHAVRGSLRDRLRSIALSRLFQGKDNAAYSLTIQGGIEQNARCRTHPNTHYLSFVTEQTFRCRLTGHHYPTFGMNPWSVPVALYMGRKIFSNPFFPGFRSEDWWHNDGLVPVYSQEFPRSAGVHPVGGTLRRSRRAAPGRWYHHRLARVNHLDIIRIPLRAHGAPQTEFYTHLFQRLACL